MLKQNPRRRTLNERPSTGRSLTIALAVTGIAFGLTGCGEEEVAAPIVQNNAPPPPPKVVVPRVTPISELMATHGIDPRIDFAEQFAPGNDAGRFMEMLERLWQRSTDPLPNNVLCNGWLCGTDTVANRGSPGAHCPRSCA